VKPTTPPKRLGFYRRLSPEQKREYDRSDQHRAFRLAADAALGRAANQVVAALATENRSATARAAQELVDAISSRLVKRRHRPPTVKVLRIRPRSAQSEFHGLYSLFRDGSSEIKVWMLTAAHGQVVKPRTFLRTLLHEVCHHLDMTLLDLPSSFHTMGFHARESFLVRVLEGSGARIPGGRGTPPPAKKREPPPAVTRRLPRPPVVASTKPVQLELFAAQPSR
jgi:hypothetical protein